MPTATRMLCLAALVAANVRAADLPKDSPFAQAGQPAASNSMGGSNLEFAGVSSLGPKVMINLYDKQAKRGFWVQVGKSDGAVTVENYDDAHDVVVIRENGIERTLPLRPPSAVENGPAPTAVPLPAAAPMVAAPAVAAAPAPPLSQARQEEEARMLVSDLLEIGMAQRRAYEAAQRKAAAEKAGTPVQPAATPSTAPGAPAQPAATATTSTPSGG
ncbi:MAG TPA: hypothetical protein VHE61_14355 [Opitutaceae bacterium]|nr:hypothetical protein [Opitutaceae bacterium]